MVMTLALAAAVLLVFAALDAYAAYRLRRRA